MKKLLGLVLALPLCLFSSQQEESTKSVAEEAEDSQQLEVVFANELPDFKANTVETPSLSVAEKENHPSPIKSKENILYLTLPTESVSQFFLPGFAYRRNLNGNFLELSYYSEKEFNIVLKRRTGFLQYKAIKKVGAVYKNILNLAYGLKWNTGYIDPYLSLGAGFYFPYVKYDKPYTANSSPTVSTAFGLSFKHGFIDLGLHYLFITSRKTFEKPEPDAAEIFARAKPVVVNLRFGFGVPF